MQVQFTERSRNAKVGPMPVSTSSNETCPDACPLKRNGCYAEAGPLGMLWRSLSGATAGGTFTTGGKGVAKALSWEQFKAAIASLPEGTLWRHNQAGDLPGLNDAIDVEALRGLVVANQGKRGYTYTHKPVTGPHGAANVAAIRDANANGFTVNLSADNLSEADELAQVNAGPVVVVLPAETQGNVKLTTPQGRRVVVCPATYRDDVNCASCKLCAVSSRQSVVGFPAHGASKRKASTVAMS